MGFQLEPDSYKLIFEDPALSGFECHMRELSLDELLDISDLLAADPRSAGARERVTKRSEMIATSITGWNLEDVNGEPVPVSAAALLSAPQRFNVAITAAWLREVVGLTAPPATISDSSTDGLDSALAQLPMMDLPPAEPREQI